MTLEEFIASLRTRSFAGAATIGFASAYISTLGMSAKGLSAHLNVDQAKIAQAVKDAANKLVWLDPGAQVTAGAIKQTDGGVFVFGDTKEAEEDRKQMDSAIMRFTNILTTKATDRDGDDLDPKGAEVDPMAPLLWQHLPDAPIGKLYKVLEQNGDFVKTACGIADTALGRDAATLIEFGALRISHGFKPKEFTPKGNKADGEEGWNITKYNVMEVSVVSIPANTGAIITAFEKNKLSTPLVKGYALALNAARPKTVKGGFVSPAADAAAGGNTVNINVGGAGDTSAIEKAIAAEFAKQAAAYGLKKKKDTESDGDATTDPKPGDDETPKDDEPAKSAPAMFREVMEAVKAIAKDKSLPAEAQARAGLVLSMLKDASVKVAEYLKAASDAGKAMDIAGFAEAAAGMVAECHTMLSRAADEMGRVGEVAGIPDGALKSIGETRDAVATIVAALDDLVSGQAAAGMGDDEGTPPPQPVDGDEDGDGNPSDDDAETADDETDDEEDTDPDAQNAADGYDADVTGDSTDGADAPADESDDEDADDDEKDDDDTDEKADDDDTNTEKSEKCPKCGGSGVLTSDTGSRRDCDRCDGEGTKADDDDDTNTEKDGEVNDGDPNPGVDDEENPGMSDADKAAAKSLAELFGEPGVVYDRATLDMLKSLTADAGS